METKGLRLAAAKRDEAGRASAAVFVPDEAREFLTEKLTQYGKERTEKGEPVNKPRFVAIDRFSAARLETLWVDKRPIPTQEVQAWWECWCWPDRIVSFEAKAQSLGLSVSDDRLKFPERIVVFVYATPKSIGRLVSSTDAVAEIRSGRYTAAFFLGEPRADQDGWISSFAQLLQDGRAANAPAVCLLDTGVNRAHPLLQSFLHADDLHAVRESWGTDDHAGHGTELAGLVLHGDLTAALQGQQPITVEISLESVKLFPPQPFSPTDPSNFGLVTLQAVSFPEIESPSRPRVFCLAVGQPDVCGPRATSWSAAIDQAA